MILSLNKIEKLIYPIIYLFAREKRHNYIL